MPLCRLREALAALVLVLSGLFAAAPVLAQPLAKPPADETLAQIRKSGVLRWGADPSGGAPFVFFNPNNPEEVVGFEVDIMAALARRLQVKPELVRSDWAALIDNMKSGRTDLVLNGLEVNPERAEVIRFTVPYRVYAQQLTVRARDQERYGSLDDLKGRKIAVLGGSQSVDVLKEAGWPDDLILKYDDSLTPYKEVGLRRADAALAESIIARYYCGNDSSLYNVPKVFAPGQYAAAVRKEDQSLLEAVNRALEEMKKSGELGEIYQKWGIWDEHQQELGIAEGQPTAESPLARAPQQSEGGWWAVIVLLLKASQYTLLLTALAMPLALTVGLALALMGRSHNPLLFLPARFYIQVVRGTPLLVQIYLIYYSLPQLGILLGLGELLTWDNFVVGVICLAANYAAYEAEIHRAGLDSVPKGQREAALSIGMSERQAFFHIVLPQSFRTILPPVLNDLISMLKDSCLVSVIGVQELLTVALGIGKARFDVPTLLVLAAVIYLLMSWAADLLGRRLESRLKQRGQAVVSAAHPPRH